MSNDDVAHSVCSSTQLLYRSLLHEKQSRKLVQSDAQRLRNRVRQLQKEDERACKRIQETKRRTDEILKCRKRNVQKHEEKQVRERELLTGIEKQRDANLQLRSELNAAKAKAYQRVVAQKQRIAQQTKKEKELIEQEIEALRLTAQHQAAEKFDAAKTAEKLREEILHRDRVFKSIMAQEEYERKVQMEVEAKLQNEHNIEELAALELELIERLKVRQVQQLQAIRQLEAALTMPEASRRTSCSPVRAPPDRGSCTSDEAAAGLMQQRDDDDDKRIAQAFANYDPQRNGAVATASLPGLLADLGMCVAEAQLREVVLQLDPALGGSITFGEFLLWWKG